MADGAVSTRTLRIARLVRQLDLELAAESLTVSELLARWLAEFVDAGHLSVGRRRSLHRHCRGMAEWFGDVMASEVGPAEVQQIREEKAATPIELWCHVSTLRQALTWGRSASLVSGPDRLKTIRVPQTRRREVVLTPKQWADVYREIEQMPCRWQTRSINDLLLLVLLTGMRPGEAAALRWGEVSIKFSSIRVLAWNEKRRVERTIELNDAAVALLERQPTRDGLVFLAPRSGRQIVSASWGYVWHQARVACRIPDCPVYACRHTWITAALEKGYLPHEIAEHCGTSGRSIFRNYAHARRERLRKMADEVPPA